MDPALATQNAFLTSRITSVSVELASAERACAAAIHAIDGPPQSGGRFLVDAAQRVLEGRLPWGEAPEPETCAGDAVKQVGTAVWTGASWVQFATVYPFLSKLPGMGPAAWEWNTAWTEAGRSLIGWNGTATDDIVIGVGDGVSDAAADL